MWFPLRGKIETGQSRNGSVTPDYWLIVMRLSRLQKLPGGGSAEQYYYARNRFLVDHADLLLAVYDKETHSRTGTGNTVRYAQGQGKPILFLNPNSLKLSYEATKTNSS